jgi:uncharacterized protein (DUF427 family)
MADHSVVDAHGTWKATWNGHLIGESDRTILVEGNHYFPLDDVHRHMLVPTDEHTFCPWKGTASYFDLVVEGDTNPGAVWYYPEPMEEAARIRDYVAFWRGVEVSEA